MVKRSSKNKDPRSKELKAEHDLLWIYPERSCRECLKYPCFRGQKNAKADFAKYGCINFEEK